MIFRCSGPTSLLTNCNCWSIRRSAFGRGLERFARSLEVKLSRTACRCVNAIALTALRGARQDLLADPLEGELGGEFHGERRQGIAPRLRRWCCRRFRE